MKITEEQPAQQDRSEALNHRLAELVQEIRVQKISVEDLLAGLRSGKGAGGTGPAVLEEDAERLRAFEYLLFENRHRGSEAEIQDRQRVYLSYFKNSGSVLDIGCGRGEFLELLKGAGIPARGWN